MQPGSELGRSKKMIGLPLQRYHFTFKTVWVEPRGVNTKAPVNKLLGSELSRLEGGLLWPSQRHRRNGKMAAKMWEPGRFGGPASFGALLPTLETLETWLVSDRQSKYWRLNTESANFLVFSSIFNCHFSPLSPSTSLSVLYSHWSTGCQRPSCFCIVLCRSPTPTCL